MHIPWSDLELFLAIADGGSLSSAAKRLRVTQSTASRWLAALEATLEEPLFARSVEGTELTAFRERMLEPARRMAECAGEAELVATRAEASPRGVVRITAPPGLASVILVPFAAELRRHLPEVELEILATATYLDLGKREADMGPRVPSLERASEQRDLVALAKAVHPVAAFASRTYASSLRRPYGVHDVRFIAWSHQLSHLPPNPELAALVPGLQPVFASDDYLIQRRAAEAGLGAMLLPRLRDTEASTLVELDLDLGGATSTTQLVAARGSLTVPRVRAVAELLGKALEATVPPVAHQTLRELRSDVSDEAPPARKAQARRSIAIR